jgi:hypothetical protein
MIFARYLSNSDKKLLEDDTQKRQRSGRMSTSEIMTIVVRFQMSHYRDFKSYKLFYESHVYKTISPTYLVTPDL